VALDIKSQTREELETCFKEWGQPAYRVSQLLQWLYARRVTDWEQMTNLPKALRDQLRANCQLHIHQLVRKQGACDTTQKFLWRMADHAMIESVLIPANPALYGEPSDRHTLCVSTQVGCAYGCKFCASGLAGFKRNLRPEEIIEQVLATERWAAAEPSANPPSTRLINNLVIMGMGEPLANYENLIKALRILNAPWGGNIGARKITISTSGLAPQIRQLAEEPEQFRLAVSLHGATDHIRQQIMPVNRKYPLDELIPALEFYQQKKGKMLTFEYILIAGVNDDPAQAKPLAQLARRLHAKVNLIPYNPVEGLRWERPTELAQDKFFEALRGFDIAANLRREKGVDIDAACGQLRLKTEREMAEN
jgi:23S rRNA (adenine2503-C2)-methyltransferase